MPRAGLGAVLTHAAPPPGRAAPRVPRVALCASWASTAHFLDGAAHLGHRRHFLVDGCCQASSKLARASLGGRFSWGCYGGGWASVRVREAVERADRRGRGRRVPLQQARAPSTEVQAPGRQHATAGLSIAAHLLARPSQGRELPKGRLVRRCGLESWLRACCCSGALRVAPAGKGHRRACPPPARASLLIGRAPVIDDSAPNDNEGTEQSGASELRRRRGVCAA